MERLLGLLVGCNYFEWCCSVRTHMVGGDLHAGAREISAHEVGACPAFSLSPSQQPLVWASRTMRFCSVVYLPFCPGFLPWPRSFSPLSPLSMIFMHIDLLAQDAQHTTSICFDLWCVLTSNGLLHVTKAPASKPPCIDVN